MPNTPGDFLIRGNLTSQDVISTTSSILTWDTEITSSGTSITYSSSGDFILDSGRYLIMHSDFVEQQIAGNTDRVELQLRLQQNRSDLYQGPGSGYIRKTQGQFEASVYGKALLDIDTDGTTINSKLYRADNSVRTATRMGGYGGVSIVALPDTLPVGSYFMTGSRTANDNIAVWEDISYLVN